MIKVYNVGQGDSFLLVPNKGCGCSHSPFLLDTGCQNKFVYKKIHYDIKKIIITHSHADHIGGLADIIKHKNITDLYIPYYLPEMLSIQEYFLNKMQLKSKPLKLKDLSNISLHMLSDGKKLCEHITIYNPPVSIPYIFDINTNNNLNDTISLVRESIDYLNSLEENLKLDKDQILNYKPDILELLAIIDREEYEKNSKYFIYSFFISLTSLLKTIKNNNINKAIRDHLKHTANAISIVLQYKDIKTSYLFTGDADISVFNRVFIDYNQNILQSDILKVPHHGSLYNIDKNIIKNISPKVVIISHGQSNQDNHPHATVLDYFKTLNIRVLQTYPLRRNNTLATIGKFENGEVEFI